MKWSFLGWIDDSAYPWIWHFEQGWFYVCPARDNSAWFYDLSGDWFYTADGVYPWIYSANRNAWLWYYEDAAAPANRYFTNAATGEMITIPKSQ